MPSRSESEDSIHVWWKNKRKPRTPCLEATEARQEVRFRLNECGATVKSEAIFALKKGGAGRKILIFNRPFMLYLKKKDAEYPYLAMWVENDGLMVKSN